MHSRFCTLQEITTSSKTLPILSIHRNNLDLFRRKVYFFKKIYFVLSCIMNGFRNENYFEKGMIILGKG